MPNLNKPLIQEYVNEECLLKEQSRYKWKLLELSIYTTRITCPRIDHAHPRIHTDNQGLPWIALYKEYSLYDCKWLYIAIFITKHILICRNVLDRHISWRFINYFYKFNYIYMKF